MRFILHPGYVTSIYDSERHYITGPQLAMLYRVPYNVCIDASNEGYVLMDGDVHLHPRHDGKYDIRYSNSLRSHNVTI